MDGVETSNVTYLPVTDPRIFLVVDDEEDNRILAGYALRKAFPTVRVLGAATIDEALQLACEAGPDGILTDHHLGAEEGSQFVRKLVAAGVNCPVVMVTSSSDPIVHQRAYDAGAAHVFFGNDWNFIGFFQNHFAAIRNG